MRTLSNFNHVALAGVLSFILRKNHYWGDVWKINPTNLRNVREYLLLSHAFNLIDEEFVILYDLNSSKNPGFSYWKYDHFDLDTLDDAECNAEFRFLKNDIYFLRESLQIAENVICSNRLVVSGEEALCILLKRFSYPIRLRDIVPRIRRSVPQLSMIAADMTNLLFNMYHHKLSSLNQQWLSPPNLQRFADAVHDAGAPLTNWFIFIDGTIRPIFRLGEMQRVVYNGHKRVHVWKFQSIAKPNGLKSTLTFQIKVFLFASMIALQKLWKMLFISS